MSEDPWGAVLGQAAKPPPAAAPAPAAIAPPAPQDADPWHGVLGAAAPAAAPATLAIPAAPAASSPQQTWLDWLAGSPSKPMMLEPRSLSQAGHDADDFVRAATNTFGLGDRFASYMGGTSLADERAKTADATARLSTPAKIAANMVGYGPLAAQGVAGALGGGLSGAIGEGAIAGPLSTIGQGDTNPIDIAKSAGETALGSGVGQTVGKYGGAALRGLASKLGLGGDPAAVTAATQQAKTDAYSVFNDAFYHPADIGVGADNVKAGIYANDADKSLRAASPVTANILDKFSNRMNDAAQARQATTGTSINDAIKQLSGVARKNPSNFEGVAATQARDGLTDLFHTAAPVSAPPGFNAASAQADAAAANSQFKNAEFLQGAQRDVFKYGDNVGPAVKAYNEKWYGQDNSPVNDALMNLYKTQQQSGAVPRYMTAIAHEGIGGLLGEGLGHAAGLPLGIGAGLGMVGTYGVAKPMLGAARGLSQGIDTQQAFDQAYPAMTGRSLSPVNTSAVADALRRLGVGVGLSR
jgi:hypothetical protein